MSTTDPFAGRRVSATIKAPESERYAADNPWLVFEGTVESVREQIIAAFGMEETEGLNLAELVLQAQTQMTAVFNAARGTGGKVVRGGGGAHKPLPYPGPPAPNAAPEKSEEELNRERLQAEIAAATDVDALKQLWARNQEAFKDDALMAEWRAKGKSLQQS